MAGVAVVLAFAYLAGIALFVGREHWPEGITIVNRTEMTVEVYDVVREGVSRME